jgi:hypothetical protein
VKRTERKTLHLSFTEQEFINLLRLGNGTRESQEYTVTAVDVTRRSAPPKTGCTDEVTVTVRLTGRNEAPQHVERCPRNRAETNPCFCANFKGLGEPSVVTPELHAKLRAGVYDKEGRPIFEPGFVLDSPVNFLMGEPVITRE